MKMINLINFFIFYCLINIFDWKRTNLIENMIKIHQQLVNFNKKWCKIIINNTIFVCFFELGRFHLIKLLSSILFDALLTCQMAHQFCSDRFKPDLFKNTQNHFPDILKINSVFVCMIWPTWYFEDDQPVCF